MLLFLRLFRLSSLSLASSCLAFLSPIRRLVVPSPGAELELSLPRACLLADLPSACLPHAPALLHSSICADMPRLGSTPDVIGHVQVRPISGLAPLPRKLGCFAAFF